VSALGSRIATLSASVVILGVLVSGCGDQPAEPPSAAATGTQTPGAGSDEASATATKVVVHQTGGIAGLDRTWTISAGGAPPPGMSPADVHRVLTIASSAEFQSMPTTRAKDICCDHFSYSVSVVYSDGSSRQYATSEAQRQAAPLDDLLGLVG
jgi:hypothetical protein